MAPVRAYSQRPLVDLPSRYCCSLIQSNFSNFRVYKKPALSCEAQVESVQACCRLEYSSECIYLGSSVEVDDAKLQHDQVQNKERKSQESGSIAFTRNCKYAHTFD
jgi:hypothetical protein